TYRPRGRGPILSRLSPSISSLWKTEALSRSRSFCGIGELSPRRRQECANVGGACQERPTAGDSRMGQGRRYFELQNRKSAWLDTPNSANPLRTEFRRKNEEINEIRGRSSHGRGPDLRAASRRGTCDGANG